jgi:ribosomal protein S12 methylthiotransferase accessory factor
LLSGEVRKAFFDGTHRLVSPQETLESIRRFFPVMGITRVADVTGLDRVGIPVVIVCRPNSRSLAVSQGKALDRHAAMASGVMESVESFMAERIVAPLVLGSFNDLRFTHELVDVEGLPRLTTSLYRDDLPILWIEGQELNTGGSRWVPYEMVHTAYTFPTPSGTGCFVGTSNGLASGNHLLEATSHAICETIERDATTLHSMRSADELVARRIDPTTVDDELCQEAIARIADAGLSIGLWNTTTDVEIASFKCMIIEGDGGPLHATFASEGMGCHPDRGIALLRAITEAAQSRLTYIAGSRDDITRRDYALAADSELVDRQRASLRTDTPARFGDVPTYYGESFDDDVAWELDRLRRAGLAAVIRVDLTREEFGVPVVRVIVPGLEGPTEKIKSCRLGPRAHRVGLGQ